MKPTRVLVADTCPVLALAVRDLLLRQHGRWEVGEVCFGANEAIEAAAKFRPQIVILDDQFPGLSGLETAARVKRRLRRVEALIYSWSHSPLRLNQICRSAVPGCLLKSESPDVLLHALEVVRGHHRFRSYGVTELCDEFEQSSRPGNGQEMTARELQIACLLADGHSAKEVAKRLGTSKHTIDSHRSRIYEKMGFRSVVDLTHYAIRFRLVKA